MKLSVIVPWLCVAGSLGGLAWFYSASQRKEAEAAALRADNEQLQKAKTELEEFKNNQTQGATEELARLRKDHDELLRLRNQVGELRGQAQQLQGQLRTAESKVQSAQAQAQAQAPAAIPKPALQPPPVVPAAPPAVSPEQANATLCINNLRLIDAAKQQWALELNKPAGAIMTPANIAVYLPSNTVPSCPAGGIYTINPVGIPPLCTVPGHTLTK